MTSRLIDVRLVLDRADRWTVSIDGRPVAVTGAQPSDVLAMLIRRIRSAAWRSDRLEIAELTDATSPLYQDQEPQP